MLSSQRLTHCKEHILNLIALLECCFVFFNIIFFPRDCYCGGMKRMRSVGNIGDVEWMRRPEVVVFDNIVVAVRDSLAESEHFPHCHPKAPCV